jgi:hypothetical protein
VSSIELPFDEGVAMATVGFPLRDRPVGTAARCGRTTGPRRRPTATAARRAAAAPGTRGARPGTRSGTRPGVRLTRRGRIVLLALMVALTGLVGVLLAASTGEAAAPAGPAGTVVVQPGDTLWSITARYAPGPDPFGTIERIRQLNGMDGYTLHAGQRLVLPARRG